MASGSKGSAASAGRHGFAVDIVIVNWNSRAHLRECLAALDRSTIAEQLNIIVVDNASDDGSVEGLTTERAPLDVVRNAENRGFAAACNQGAERGAAPKQRSFSGPTASRSLGFPRESVGGSTCFHWWTATRTSE